ncbi:MAG: hypothetical protein OXI26_03540 [bacterium]|nr:hypothetical protein [bacterium]
MGFIESGVLFALPPVIVALFGSSPARDALAVAVLNVGAVPLIYLLTSHGVLPMVRWASVFMTRQIRQVV